MFTKIMASILAMLMSLLSFFFPGFVIPGTEVVDQMNQLWILLTDVLILRLIL